MWGISRCLSRLQVQSLLKPSTRLYMKTSDKMELLLKQADNVPFNYELVYRHKNYRMGSFMYHTINFMGLVTATNFAHKFYKHGFAFTGNTPELSEIFATPFETVLILSFSIGIIILASKIRSRYAIRIYYNEKNNMFKAIFYGKIPYTIEHYDFPAGGMTYTSITGTSILHDISFIVNGRKLMLFEELFKTQSYFYKMLAPGEMRFRNM